MSTSPLGDEAVRLLAKQIDYPVVRRHSRNAASTEALMMEARASWAQDFVIVVDPEAAVVRVLRLRDGTVGSRVLDRDAISAPYAIALAAAELLEIIKDAPAAKVAALPPPPLQRPAEGRIGPSLWAGLLMSVSDNGDVQLVQPALGIELHVERYPSPVWFAFGLNAAGLTAMSRTQLLILPTGPDEGGSITYARNQVAARSAVGHAQGPSRALAFVDLGAASISVLAEDGSGTEIRRTSRWTFYAALGGELRYAVWEGFFLGIGGGIHWLPSPQRFWATPEGADVPLTAFREGYLEFRAQPVTLVWTGSL